MCPPAGEALCNVAVGSMVLGGTTVGGSILNSPSLSSTPARVLKVASKFKVHKATVVYV